jgi:hypothetical protein
MSLPCTGCGLYRCDGRNRGGGQGFRRRAGRPHESARSSMTPHHIAIFVISALALLFALATYLVRYFRNPENWR